MMSFPVFFRLPMHSVPRFSLLTFYRFVDIPADEVERLVAEQRGFGQDIGLRGRVYIGTEGISSTVTGNE
jgi:predicted sulfurtransferase